MVATSGSSRLVWGVGGAVAPVAYTWLLEHGTYTIWAVLGLVAVLGATASVALPRALPTAGERVTAG